MATVDILYYDIFNFLISLGIAILVIFIGRWLAGRIRKWMEPWLLKTALTETLISVTLRVTSYAVIFVAVLIALAIVGFPTTSLIASIGIIIVILGVALQESLASFAATVSFLLFQPFKIGELIETNGTMGTVREIAIFHTVLTKADNTLISISNAEIQNHVLVNYSRQGTLRADMSFRVGYQDDLRKAKELLMTLATSDPRTLAEPATMVVVQELADDAIILAVRPWVSAGDYWLYRADFLEKAKLSFDQEGITIPLPQRTIYVEQARPSTTTQTDENTPARSKRR